MRDKEKNNKRKKSTKKSGRVSDETRVVRTTEKSKKGKKKNKKGKGKKVFFTLLKIIIVCGLLAGLIAAGIIAGIFFGLFGDDFKITKDELIIKSENSTVYDSEGNLLATINGDEKRKIVTLSEMNEYLPKAYVAIEDERFYNHNGVDIKRTAAATATYILNGGNSKFGGSTLTQQLVKNITNQKQKDWTRKVKEMARAIQVENLISKDQILELYLNVIFVGEDVYGVALASELYFSKNVKDLTIAECAFLAGINHTPNSYKPFKEFETEEKKQEMMNLINKRTKTVLGKMKEVTYINEEQYNQAIAEVDAGLKFQKGSSSNSTEYSYITLAAINQIKNQLMEEKDMNETMAETYIYSSGLKIYTTEKPSIQNRLEEEMRKPKYIVKSYTGENKHSQAAMVIIDHTTGKVVGCVGGVGDEARTRKGNWNRATQSTKATGSAMKPLAVIAPAVQAGIITAGSVYDDAPTTEFNGRQWPKNYYGGYKGLSTVRYAIEISQNIVPVRIISQLGVEKSVDFLRKAGISTVTDTEGFSLALGGMTYGVTPLEMSAGYAMIANDGEYIEPTFYSEVKNSKDEVVLQPNQRREKLLSTSQAYIVKNILMQPVVGGAGTATYCKISGKDVCAKTGTTSDDFDRWLCGFTPYYTSACWFGYDNNETVHYLGNPAGKIWDAVMTDIHKGLEAKRFTVPGDIIRVGICKDSGKLPNEFCSQDQRGSRVYTEVFIKGTAPSERCDCHVKAQVCEATGKNIAEGSFCTAVERVYITRPNGNAKTNWKAAGDAAYMLPTEECMDHKEDPNAANENVENTNTNTNGVSSSNTVNNADKNTNTSDKNTNTTNTSTNTSGGNTNTNTSTNTNTGSSSTNTVPDGEKPGGQGKPKPSENTVEPDKEG